MHSDLYKADAAVGANDTPGVPEMVVYQVAKRFVDNEDSASDEATSIVYYALGIGHHTGIIDCFEERLRCSMGVFEDVLTRLDNGNASEGMEISSDREDGVPSTLLDSKLRTAYTRGEAYIDKYDLQPLTERIDSVLGDADPYRNLPLAEIPDPERIQAANADSWLEEFRILLDRMMADWDASLIVRRRGL